MAIIQTAERSSQSDPSENVIFQRHLIAYKGAAKLIEGTVLELGSGEGYGIKELAPYAEKYIAVDKYVTKISDEIQDKDKVQFVQLEFPPLHQIDDQSVDCVVTFQVIEHIYEDEKFLEEIFRVLKKGGKLILTTPNKLMSLTRNPWHIREYDPQEMKSLIEKYFQNYKVKGVFGNDKVMSYYNKNKQSIKRFTKFDILNMQYWLPRWILQIPYDIVNRINRQYLQDENSKIVSEITYKDYLILETNENSLDHFCIATK